MQCHAILGLFQTGRGSVNRKSHWDSYPRGEEPSGCSRIVGKAKSKELIFSGQIINAQEALRIGLVNKIVPDGEELRAATDYIRMLSAKVSPLALAQAKIAINKGLQKASLEEGLQYEIEAMQILGAESGSQGRSSGVFGETPSEIHWKVMVAWSLTVNISVKGTSPIYDYKLPPKYEFFRDVMREFLRTEIADTVEYYDKMEKFPVENIRKFAEHGYMGIPIPQKYGGAELGEFGYGLAVQEIGKLCSGHGTILGAHTGLCCVPIWLFGNEDQTTEISD